VKANDSGLSLCEVKYRIKKTLRNGMDRLDDILTYRHPDVTAEFLKDKGVKGRDLGLLYLKEITKAFSSIPYENITKIIAAAEGDGISRLRLPEVLYSDHIRFGTGGTCFSMTYFLVSILCDLGFSAYPVLADRPLVPNSHAACIVLIGGRRYLIDPAFMIDEPLLISEERSVYHLAHNSFLIGRKRDVEIDGAQLEYLRGFRGSCIPYWEREEGCYVVATLRPRLKVRYLFSCEPANDFKFLSCWLDSFDWPGMKNISIARPLKDGYMYIRGDLLRIEGGFGRRQERIKDDWVSVIRSVIGLDRRLVERCLEITRRRRYA